MRKALLALVALLVAVVAVAAAYLTFLLPASRPAPAISAGNAPERVARGEYLVEHVVPCLACHGHRDNARYGAPSAGPKGVNGECFDEAIGFPGRVCPPNLTPGANGIGEWTDGELLRAMREGISRDGHGLFPAMPYADMLNVLADEDALAIIAYLRTLPPVDSTPPERVIPFAMSLATKFAPRVVDTVASPDRADPVAYGRYLATVGGCQFCHTPVDEEQMPIRGREFSGGQEFLFAEGYRVRSSNITPHATGIGALSEENFVDLFRAYVNVDEVAVPARHGVNTPMPWYWYAGMNDEDLRAIYAFLQTVPPLDNTVDSWPDRQGG